MYAEINSVTNSSLAGIKPLENYQHPVCCKHAIENLYTVKYLLSLFGRYLMWEESY